MTGSLSETPFSARVLTSSLAKLNSPRARDCVVSRFISSYSNGMRSSKERYIIDRGSHRSQRWCNLSNSVRKCVSYTTTSITLRGASGVRMRSAGPSLKRGPGRHSARPRSPPRLRDRNSPRRRDERRECDPCYGGPHTRIHLFMQCEETIWPWRNWKWMYLAGGWVYDWHLMRY